MVRHHRIAIQFQDQYLAVFARCQLDSYLKCLLQCKVCELRTKVIHRNICFNTLTVAPENGKGLGVLINSLTC